MDKQAVKILTDSLWSSSGWIRVRPVVPDDDFRHAKAHGVMFDPISPTHDEAISRVRAAASKLSPRRAADGFLASLSTRRVDWRSALGSYSVARCMPAHAASCEARHCAICGLHDDVHVKEHDLNVPSFERLKWGGVRHADPIYAALDLELFLASPPPPPTEADVAIFRDLVAALPNAPASVTSAKLHKHLPTSLKANKAERDMLVAILGLCGVLGTADHPGFFDQFVPVRQRRLPNRHFIDMAYPACWWTRSDGVNTNRLQELFGHVL